MFGFLHREANQAKLATETKPTTAYVAPGTQIAYKHSLISEYSAEHKQLLTIFNDAVLAYEQGRDDEFVAILQDLKTGLRKHLLDEEMNLYIYLRHCYMDNNKYMEIIKKFKKD